MIPTEVEVPMPFTPKAIQITPALATFYLSFNRDNRELMRRRVEVYAEHMRRGEFRHLPTEAIAFSKVDGRLLDGQHRLWAVVQSGVTCTMTVVKDADPKDAMYMDKGAPRTFADSYDIDKPFSWVVNFVAGRFARMAGPEFSRVATEGDKIEVAKALEDGYYDLMAACSRNVSGMSLVSVKAAAILNLLNGSERNYVLDSYASLCAAQARGYYKEGEFYPVVAAFFGWMNSPRSNKDTNGGAQQDQKFYAAWTAFDSTRRGQKNMKTLEPSTIRERARFAVQRGKALAKDKDRPRRRNRPGDNAHAIAAE